MKILNYTLGLLIAFSLMIIGVITSVEAVAYWTPNYYEKEYTKYSVANDVDMEMEDLLDVTKEMMAYLRGNREDLRVPTIVGGHPREFFNEREISHMEDVRGLFLASLNIRRICFATVAACIVSMILLKADIKKILPQMIQLGTVLFLLICTFLGIFISTDFTKYFIKFHEIFFNNDLWILDPSTDLLINIVPESFFMDTVLRISITFAGFAVILFLLCGVCLRIQKKNG